MSTPSAEPAPAPRAVGADADWRRGGFGVYVHWPFCQAKCPYCDFNSHVVANVDQSRWRDALTAEVRAMRRLSGPRAVDTVFFGGGTPSLMDPSVVAAVLDAVDEAWGMSDRAEISLEANPTSVEAARFQGYRAAGVNRLSMGVQALNDANLRALGRMHTAAEAMAAFDVARAAFDRVSFDLICTRVGQSVEAWADELHRAIDAAVDHLSIYQLTIEPGTRFAELHARGRLIPPDDDVAAEMYLATQETCEAAGLIGYEVSNHARPGAESRHNLVYWRYGDYAGVGPGAHGRLTTANGRIATETVREPGAWLQQVEASGRAVARLERVDDVEQAEEMLMMGLRLREGVSRSRFAALAGRPLRDAALADLVDQGVLALDGETIAATGRGRLVLNHILRTLLA